MSEFDINYPSLNYKNYIECFYKFCQDNRLSMILKDSLANSRATKYSDIDLIILGDIIDLKIDEIITLYSTPIMTNFIENPKCIII